MDYYYKAHADTAGTFNGSYHGRGGSNQYTGVPQTHNAFQSRRIYLGFDYTLNKHFQAEFLLADEDNFNTTNTTASTATVGGGGTGTVSVPAPRGAQRRPAVRTARSSFLFETGRYPLAQYLERNRRTWSSDNRLRLPSLRC